MAEIPERRGRDALARKGALRFLLEPPSATALAMAADDHPLTRLEQRAVAALAWATHELDRSPVGDNTEKSEALTDVLMLAACADGEVQPNELRALGEALMKVPYFQVDDLETMVHQLVQAAARVGSEGEQSVLDLARERLPDISERRSALRLAALVTLTDHTLETNESAILRDIAKALHLSATELSVAVLGATVALGEGQGKIGED
jgi:tellurite resistance protein